MEPTFFESFAPLHVDTLPELDGQWAVEGDVYALNERDRRLGDSSALRVHSEEVFIVSADPERAPVVRRVLAHGIVSNDEPKEFTARKRCHWASSEPFAVLVVQSSRERCRKPLRIFWSKQYHKDGEIVRYIPTRQFPIVKATGPNGEDWKWVNLLELAAAASIETYVNVLSFLSLKIFGSDSSQPSFVAAEDQQALASGAYSSYPKAESPSGTYRTLFLAATHDPSNDLLPEKIWVAIEAAEKVLRIVSLGVTNHLDLFPTHFV